MANASLRALSRVTSQDPLLALPDRDVFLQVPVARPLPSCSSGLRPQVPDLVLRTQHATRNTLEESNVPRTREGIDVDVNINISISGYYSGFWLLASSFKPQPSSHRPSTTVRIYRSRRLASPLDSRLSTIDYHHPSTLDPRAHAVISTQRL